MTKTKKGIVYEKIIIVTVCMRYVEHVGISRNDTFSAAAAEQWCCTGSGGFAKGYGSDPAAVGFDAVKYAKKHKIDVVLIDTAGRMQNKDSLMREIEKIVRVNNPDMRIFLGESITGNDAIEQAKVRSLSFARHSVSPSF